MCLENVIASSKYFARRASCSSSRGNPVVSNVLSDLCEFAGGFETRPYGGVPACPLGMRNSTSPEATVSSSLRA